MRRFVAIAVAAGATACGRIHFDPLDDARESGDDTAGACAFTFCDDFDRAGPVEAGWDMQSVEGAAALALASDATVSPPQSLLLSMPAALEAGLLVKTFPLTATSARVLFAFAYETTNGGTAEVDLVRLRWETPPAPCTSFGYYFVRDGTRPFDLQETYGGCGGNEDTAFEILDNTGFHTVEMIVTFGPIGTARLQVAIDGVPRVDKPTSHAIPASALRFEIGGDPVRNVVAPWSIRYDDVIVDLQ